jgi:hypothetical protein
MDRLCDWVHRYNKLGLQDPFDRFRRNGPVIALSTEPVVCRSSAVRRGMAGSRPSSPFPGKVSRPESGHSFRLPVCCLTEIDGRPRMRLRATPLT